MTEKSRSVIRQSFEASHGEWRTRVVDFPTSYLRSRVFQKGRGYISSILIFEVKKVESGLATLTETIDCSVATLEELETFLDNNYIDIRSRNSETTPSGFEHHFHTPLGPTYYGEGSLDIKMVEGGVINELLVRAESENNFTALAEEVKKRGKKVATPVSVQRYYQGPNYKLALPSSLRVKSLISQAIESS